MDEDKDSLISLLLLRVKELEREKNSLQSEAIDVLTIEAEKPIALSTLVSKKGTKFPDRIAIEANLKKTVDYIITLGNRVLWGGI